MKNATRVAWCLRFRFAMPWSIASTVAVLLSPIVQGDTVRPPAPGRPPMSDLQSNYAQGMAEWRLGRIENATALLQAAADLCFTPPDTYASDSGPVFFALAQVYEQAGRYTEAERNYLIALSIMSRVMPEHSIEAIQTLGKIAGFYIRMGDAARAEPYALRALKNSQTARIPDPLVLVDAFRTMGLVNRHLGEFDRAERCLRDSLDILGSIPGAPVLHSVASLHMLSAVKSDQGDLESAYGIQSDALRRIGSDQTISPLVRATHLNNLGWYALGLSRFDSASAHLEQALALYENAGEQCREDLANTAATLALIAAHRQKPEALVLARRSDAIYTRLIDDVMRMGTEDQKVAFIRKIEGKVHLALELHLALYPEHPDFARLAFETVLRRKDISAETMRPALDFARGSRDPGVRAKLRELEQMQSELSRMALLADKRYGVDEAKRLWELSRAMDSRLREFAQQVRDWRTYATAGITIERVSRELPPGSVLAEFVLYHPSHPGIPRHLRKQASAECAVYLLFPDGRFKGLRLGRMADIEPLIAELIATVSRPRGASDPVASRLAAVLLHPWLAETDGASMLLMAPDGPLHLIPFGALPDRTGRPLLERMPVAYLNSGRDLLYLERRAPSRTPPVILAQPDYNGAAASAAARGTVPPGQATHMIFDPLPGTGKEADLLARMLPDALVHMGADASETALRAVRGPAILHIATHGFFLDANQTLASGTRAVKIIKPMTQEQPTNAEAAGTATVQRPRPSPDFDLYRHPFLRAGLALAGANRFAEGPDDGILTAMEVRTLDLAGTELAVLSACETGVGSTDGGVGVFGLRRAFLQAGARTQVLSLWKVDDEATVALMALFYRHLAEGKGKAEALRLAQMGLARDNPQWRHPFYWGAFLLSGDWRPFSGTFMSNKP